MLTDQELQDLQSGDAAKVAAVAKKLKDLRDTGEYVPKNRLSEVAQKRTELEQRLEEIEKQKAADEQARLVKNQEFQKLAEDRAAELAAANRKLKDLEPIVKQHDELRKARLDDVKKKLGDQFLPEYENFSVQSLEKILGTPPPKPPDTNSSGSGKIFEKSVGELSPEEFEQKLAQAKAGAFIKKS